MARQLVLFSCLVTVVFSSLNCSPAGPSIDGSCPPGNYKLIGFTCYQCSEGNLPNCAVAGPAIVSPCPSDDMILQFGLGPAADPFGTGICTKCPSSG